MKKHDIEKFTQIMLCLADNYSVSLSEKSIDFRFDELKEYSIEQIEKASKKIIRSRKYLKMPTIADFIEAIEGNKQDSTQLIEVKACEVLKLISSYGIYRQPSFSDPLIERVIRSRFGGWRSLCETHEIANNTWFVKEFVEAYQAYQEQDKLDSANLIAGNEPVKLIADEQDHSEDLKKLTDGIFQSVNKPDQKPVTPAEMAEIRLRNKPVFKPKDKSAQLIDLIRWRKNNGEDIRCFETSHPAEYAKVMEGGAV